MRFEEIAERLTGVSCPIFGISWNPPEAERTVARRVVTYLEDRRVLYVPHELEVPQHCVHSVLEIRSYLTEELQGLSRGDELTAHLRAMRASCRRFLNKLQRDGESIVPFASQPGHWATWIFYPALGELRSAIGLQLGLIATKYGIDVEDELASVLPAPDSNDDPGDSE